MNKLHFFISSHVNSKYQHGYVSYKLLKWRNVNIVDVLVINDLLRYKFINTIELKNFDFSDDDCSWQLTINLKDIKLI